MFTQSSPILHGFLTILKSIHILIYYKTVNKILNISNLRISVAYEKYSRENLYSNI